MPRELDPPPVDESPARKKGFIAHEVVSAVPNEKRGHAPGHASFKEYEKLLKDRPKKFNGERVKYREAEDAGKECEHCVHFYEQVADAKRTVCEILRPEPEAPINPEWVCDFFTRDGVDYPYQKKGSSQSKMREERESD